MMTPASTISPIAASLYVYYRVPLVQRRATLDAVRHMQTRLSTDWPGLQARLMRRADAPVAKGLAADTSASVPEETWMETYEHPSGVSEAIVQAIALQAEALPAGLMGERHVELFVPLTWPDA